MLVTHTEDLYDQARVSVEPGKLVRFRKPVYDVGHVTHRECAAVRPRSKHELLKLLPAIGLSLGAQQYFAALRAERPPGQVQRRPPDGGGHLVERHSVLPQGLLRDLDRDLIRPRVLQFHLRDARDRGNLVSHLLAKVF